VQLLEPIGSDTFVELASGDATIVARVAPDSGLELGQNVTAELLPGRIHLFEREHGERIVE
jgi:ABC-type sugar transport system ATPase subunit